mmetsp:Transcript_21674/g.43506  ORF Transcript_21674/g.43506 Transcript_21674/m.43506 type:complete len:255 (-) Transcript_21674:591-1355(-)
MASNPSTICHTRKDIIRLKIKRRLNSVSRIKSKSSRSVNQTLRHPGATRRIQKEKLRLRIHWLRRTVRTLQRKNVIHIDIPPLYPIHTMILFLFTSIHSISRNTPLPLKDQNLFHHIHTPMLPNSVIHNPLQRNRLSAPHPHIGSHHHSRLRRRDPRRKSLARKPGKYHGMHRSDSGACQHRHGQLRNHGHVDGDDISFLHSLRFQCVGDFGYLALHFRISESQDLAGFVSLPYHGQFVGSVDGVSVDGVVADV